ncbi:DUF2523 domain-containing protein [Aeromonas sp. sif2433]|jgi:hypothetical protein|uniref:DUF2523 domain-containing protein n=1 Tax=Aeromonas sp. sif2433 TaxID=2854794 RepID=UPI001C475617|nr:DUF2523 domain-containing protein [Aeromonas sp. sif2433]MBV7415132.1 DUF2523 domain-containing protein [Aeromonas sp. sif2433]MBV7415140.1 DUF2523 domain-containing protein [Aeromonas sp. sif2433]
MNIAAWLLSISGPIITRVLIQLGIGIVSYAAVSAAVGALINSAKSSYLGLPSDILAILAMSGANDALGIIAAAITARLALQVTKRFQIK